MRKTIYVPSQEVWDEVEAKAKAMGLKVSPYLLGGYHLPNESQMDRIERKIDSLTPKTRDTPIIDPMAGLPDVEVYDDIPPIPEIAGMTVELPNGSKIEFSDEKGEDHKGWEEGQSELLAANERLKEKQRSIKAEKIANTKGKIRPDDEVVDEVRNQLGQRMSGAIPKKGKK